MFSINCKGKLLNFEKPLVMGIINITDDSFYEGSRMPSLQKAMQQAKKMLDEGAAILDIGGQSTRPGSMRLSADEEMDRILPLIIKASNDFPGIIISADTYHAAVAREAVAAGASVINDISGGMMDKEMLTTVAAMGVPYICMHMKGTPDTMQANPHYENVVCEVLDFFIERTDTCKRHGINDVIIDPGFGFGKTAAHNFSLLKNLAVLKMLDKPILAGLSRKATIYKTLGITAKDALNGSTVMHTLALQNGASVLRVHDVLEAVQAVRLVEAYQKAGDAWAPPHRFD